MKTSALVLAMAGAAAAASAPCDPASLGAKLLPILGTAPFKACGTVASFDLTTVATGAMPSEAQVKMILASPDCQELYKSLQTSIGSFTPACSIGGVETTAVTTLEMSKGFELMLKSFASLAGPTSTKAANGTADSNSTIKATTVPTAGSQAAATSTPKPSSAASVGLTMAAVVVAAALH
ncbi:hypothetical protein SPRG_16352 [Saprolegnia parasitica CBS 223.65]|uniref:Elicitin n=1 Tax=Saprolegnia parasitica (strain CBS 223.65) TaxID=695850 RepID=A0A067BN25_SAPPC|nr:hypothetical protein SPRG_16352 [Saprolegnia parasitica CBS 223.65]KDO18145.1 hypothetical protein SPRG_16352 [Saprolegnia parasitica CBS 223.65]|eukprot:XP_012211146.1 hypothetical protein SPRG_16352 [Saprolegnia parasitica CBS 223.65]